MNTNSLQSNETPIYNVHVVDLWSEKEAVLDLSTQILEGQDFRVIAVTLIQGMKCFGFLFENLEQLTLGFWSFVCQCGVLRIWSMCSKIKSLQGFFKLLFIKVLKILNQLI